MLTIFLRKETRFCNPSTPLLKKYLPNFSKPPEDEGIYPKAPTLNVTKNSTHQVSNEYDKGNPLQTPTVMDAMKDDRKVTTVHRSSEIAH